MPRVTEIVRPLVKLSGSLRGCATPARLLRQTKIGLLAAEGRESINMGEELSVERTFVGRRRKRFDATGRAGIEKGSSAWRSAATKTNAATAIQNAWLVRPRVWITV